MKSLTPFTPLVSLEPLGPLISALPPALRIGYATVVLSLVGLYYVFLAIRAFPWPPTRPVADSEHRPCQEKRRRHRPRRKQRRHQRR